MADLVVPAPPPLATVPNVELMHTGTWNLSTGPVTFSTDDLAGAVAALDCPAVRRPVLKLGHLEPDPDEHGLRWDGLPAVGYITNMAVAEDGRTLVGDYSGMPGWLGPIIASAYPDRSIEGQFDHRCQMGHLHPFVITAVALLGVAAPGIGTLQSLQDVAELYGVAATPPPPSGEPVAVTVHATREDTVPNPRAPQVAAGVTTEDVRRAFYSSDYGRGWDIWIEAIELEPMQIIAIDDATGTRSRVPVTIGDGDGEAAVSFDAPVPVVVRYEDAPAVSATAEAQVIRYASRAESRPQASTPPPVQPAEPVPATPVDPPIPAPPVAPPTPPVSPVPQSPPVEPGPNPNEGEAMPALDEGLRTRLGLGADADEATILSALDEALAERAEPTEAASPALPDGTVAIDEATLADLREQAAQGVAARARQLTEDRDRAIDDAIKAGKTPPARREHWQAAWTADPDGTRQLLASLAPGLVPLADIGQPGGEETGPADDEFDHMFSTPGRSA
ncbi:phage protease [Streptosporangium saharense]|uniref:phage protease n=1 Tax=Streptosporangium saharense TaxID=1706840 RepID=UPI00331AAFEB